MQTSPRKHRHQWHGPTLPPPTLTVRLTPRQWQRVRPALSGLRSTLTFYTASSRPTRAQRARLSPPTIPRTNEHLAVLLPKNLWKVSALVQLKGTASHLRQPDTLASTCDNFYCRVKFTVLERRHVRFSSMFRLARQNSTYFPSSTAESVAVCFAAVVPLGLLTSWMSRTLIFFILPVMSQFPLLTVLRHLSAWRRFVMIVGTKFMAPHAPLTRDRQPRCWLHQSLLPPPHHRLPPFVLLQSSSRPFRQGISVSSGVCPNSAQCNFLILRPWLLSLLI